MNKPMKLRRKRENAKSQYPTTKQISRASRTRLGYWVRHLPSPGETSVDAPNHVDVMTFESAAMDFIIERFEKHGGWDPGVSKAVDRLHEQAS